MVRHDVVHDEAVVDLYLPPRAGCPAPTVCGLPSYDGGLAQGSRALLEANGGGVRGASVEAKRGVVPAAVVVRGGPRVPYEEDAPVDDEKRRVVGGGRVRGLGGGL